MAKLLKKHWPLIIAVFVLWISIAVLLILAINLNHGHFGYPLDDVYIHMAMAKNVVLHGVWGVDKYEFSSTTSSPLWTLLLSFVYLLFGVNELSPLILNIILGTLLIGIVYTFLWKFSMPVLFKLTVLLAIIYFTPLLPIIFGGMEHVLHVLLTLLFVYLSGSILSKKGHIFKEHLYLILLAPFLTTVRYEGMFLVFVVCLLFFLRKRPWYSLLLGLVSAIPIVTFGLISIKNGWNFFPNSILLKANIPTFTIIGIESFFYHGFVLMVSNMHIFLLFLASLFLLVIRYFKQKTFWVKPEIMLVIFIGITILHLLFASIGWFYRYEAYFIALGIFTISVGIYESITLNFFLIFQRKMIPWYLSLIIITSIALYPQAKRGFVSLVKTCYAIKNVNEQQYQMGLFLKQFYQDENVAANDIGAINFLADIKCLDLWGLNSMEVLNAKRNGSYSTQIINSISKLKNIKIAILYSKFYDSYGGIPASWNKAGEWTIQHNVVCGGNTVTFYAMDTSELEKLKLNLKVFFLQASERCNPVG